MYLDIGSGLLALFNQPTQVVCISRKWDIDWILAALPLFDVNGCIYCFHSCQSVIVFRPKANNGISNLYNLRIHIRWARNHWFT